MFKTTEFIKSKKILLLTIISLTSLIFVIVKISNNKNIKIQEIPIYSPVSGITNFDSIVPGKTSIERINELLGNPLNSTISGDLKISSYKSTNKYRNHKVYSKDGLAELVVEEVINKSKIAKDIQKEYGVAPEILYSESPTSAFKLYVYPDKGIAYLGHQDGTILEIWYFVPTTIDDFISKWGSDYLKEPSKVIPKY